MRISEKILQPFVEQLFLQAFAFALTSQLTEGACLVNELIKSYGVWKSNFC